MSEIEKFEKLNLEMASLRGEFTKILFELDQRSTKLQDERMRGLPNEKEREKEQLKISRQLDEILALMQYAKLAIERIKK